MIEGLRAERADFKVADRAAAKGDYVRFGYTGTLDGKPVAEVVGDKAIYASAPQTWEEVEGANEGLLPGMSKQIAGLKASDKKTVTINFPAGFAPVPALAGKVDIGYVKATGHSVKIYLPKTAMKPEVEFEWKVPRWSNAIERDRARTYFQAYSAACALYFVEKALAELHAGRTKTFTPFEVPDEAIGCGFHEAVRGVLSHHVVIRKGKIANYHPYPPTPWNASTRDSYGTPGPYEDAVQGQPIFEENDREHFKGIDIMRTVRSFDPCLPCGVHMYLGKGKTLDLLHSPTQSVTGE